MNNEKGFTLLEIIVVTSLLALMSSVLYSTLNGFISSKHTVLEGRTAQRTATAIFSRLNKELLSRSAEQLSEINSGPAPLNQYMYGENKDVQGKSADTLRFVSDGAAQELFGGLGNKGRVEIEYRLEKNDDGLSFGDKESTPFVFVRQETPSGEKDKRIREQKKIVFPLADNIESFNVRFYQRGEWKNSWKVGSPRFPEAIEISLAIRGSKGGIEYYQSAFTIDSRRTGSK